MLYFCFALPFALNVSLKTSEKQLTAAGWAGVLGIRAKHNQVYSVRQFISNGTPNEL